MYKHRENTLKIPILMYHEVVDEENYESLTGKIQYSYVVRKKDFEKQIGYLKKNNFKTLTIAEMCSLFRSDLSGRHFTDKKYVVLTFDDGYLGNYETVFPILLKNDFVGNFFIIASRIGSNHMLSWSQIVEMDRSGMYFGSHTMTHSLLGSLSENKVIYELKESKKILEDRLGKDIRFLSVPHGSYNDKYKSIAMSLGYVGGCTSDPGLNDRDTDPFFLKRMNVSRYASLNYFINLCEKNKKAYFRAVMKKKIIGVIKRIVGETLYLTAYNRIFGVRES